MFFHLFLSLHCNAFSKEENIDFFSHCNKSIAEPKTCSLLLALVEHESGGIYSPFVRGDYGCSWGIIQFNACVHLNLKRSDANYINVVFSSIGMEKEKERLKDYNSYFTLDFQKKWLFERAKERAKSKLCHDSVIINGIKLTKGQLCVLKLHNWNAGPSYLSRIIDNYKEIEWE